VKVSPKISSLRKNYRSILGVTFLAFVLWFMVKMNKVYEYAMDVPIHYSNLDQDKIFKYPHRNFVHVDFVGKGLDLLRLRFYKVSYMIDLSGVARYAEFDLTEHPEYVNFPRELDVTVKSILRPRTLVVEIDRKMQKKLPVEVDYDLDEPPGMILVGVHVVPDSVLVTGPAEMFTKVDRINTEKKEFKETDKSFTQEFQIQESREYFAEYDPTRVKVTFDIQRLAEKEVPDVPVTIIDKPANLEVIPLPSTATIYVKGGEKILADLSMQDFQIIIDFRKEWNPGVQKVKADIKTEANVLYVETRPPYFELIVQKKRGN
jgi:YbbR domain-containing protein